MYQPSLTHVPEPLILNGFRPSNCPHRRPYAAAHFQSFAAGGPWLHRSDNTFPDWSGDRKSLRTGSMVCGPSYEKAPLLIPCPVAGPQFGNIYRSAIWKYSGRRRGHPSHRPAAGNSRCHDCSTHAPIFESIEIAGSLNVVNLTFNFPFSRFAKKRAACLRCRPPSRIIQLVPSSSAPVPGAAYCVPGNRPAASSAFPSPPVPPAWVQAWAHRISR